MFSYCIFVFLATSQGAVDRDAESSDIELELSSGSSGDDSSAEEPKIYLPQSVCCKVSKLAMVCSTSWGIQSFLDNKLWSSSAQLHEAGEWAKSLLMRHIALYSGANFQGT